MYYANTLAQLFAAGIILSVGIGFMEAPLHTYIGEISQPKWRGALIQYSRTYHYNKPKELSFNLNKVFNFQKYITALDYSSYFLSDQSRIGERQLQFLRPSRFWRSWL